MPLRVVSDTEALLAVVEACVAGLEAQMCRDALRDPRVAALCAIPGVGVITAMTLVAEIGDIGRFPTARKLCAWGPGSPPRCATRIAKPTTATSPKTAPGRPSRARRSRPRRPPLRALRGGLRRYRPSPGHRDRLGSHLPETADRGVPHPARPRGVSRARVGSRAGPKSACACNTAVDLTETAPPPH